jgi:hypothetical protein
MHLLLYIGPWDAVSEETGAAAIGTPRLGNLTPSALGAGGCAVAGSLARLPRARATMIVQSHWQGSAPRLPGCFDSPEIRPIVIGIARSLVFPVHNRSVTWCCLFDSASFSGSVIVPGNTARRKATRL